MVLLGYHKNAGRPLPGEIIYDKGHNKRDGRMLSADGRDLPTPKQAAIPVTL
jgi:hypothetical protein